MSIIWLSLALIVVGLIMCYLHASVRYATLATVVLWAGITVVVVGLILLCFPVLAWIHAQIVAAIGGG